MIPPAHDHWWAMRDAAGQWVVGDQDGKQPLRSADPLERVVAVHLAAAAPQLQAALKWLIEDLHNLELKPMHVRHRVRLNFAEVVLTESQPPVEEVVRLSRMSQMELDFAA